MGRLDGVTNSMDTSVSKQEDSEGQESLECCRSWSRKELDVTERLNNWPVKWRGDSRYLWLYLSSNTLQAFLSHPDNALQSLWNAKQSITITLQTPIQQPVKKLQVLLLV